MKISASDYTYYNNTNFKSTFPVVHWVAETNGSYAYVANMEIVEQLQEKIVRYLNTKLLTKKSAASLKKAAKRKERPENSVNKQLKELMNVSIQNFRSYMALADVDYRILPKVRSFYNSVSGNIQTPTAMSYIITGKHVNDFNDKFAKEIGKQTKLNKSAIEERIKEECIRYQKELYSGKNKEELYKIFQNIVQEIKKTKIPGLEKALHNYHHNGPKYINRYFRRIKDEKGVTQVLHTKFEIVRDKEGKFEDYRFVDARFLPEYGPYNPFERLKR